MEKVVNTAVGLSIVVTGTSYLISPKLAVGALCVQAVSLATIGGGIAGVYINAAWTEFLAKHMPKGGGNGTTQMGLYLLMLVGGGVAGAVIGGATGFVGSLYMINRMLILE
jgi:hypothetical protein